MTIPTNRKLSTTGEVPPDQFRPNFRTARWTSWAYLDVPTTLVQVYDWIRDSGVTEQLSRERGVDVAKRIETDLFRRAAHQVLANAEEYSNMSPGMWNSITHLGRVIGEPQYGP